MESRAPLAGIFRGCLAGIGVIVWFPHYSDVIMSAMASHTLDCLLNRLHRRRSMLTSKLRVTGFCEGNPPVTGGFPSQIASNTENVSICWCYSAAPATLKDVDRKWQIPNHMHIHEHRHGKIVMWTTFSSLGGQPVTKRSSTWRPFRFYDAQTVRIHPDTKCLYVPRTRKYHISPGASLCNP